jgi:signal transduction histidine kinase
VSLSPRPYPSPQLASRDSAAPVFELALSLLYLSVLAAYLVRIAPQLAAGTSPWYPVVLIAGAIAGLVAIERWEFVQRAETLPRGVAVLVLVLRAILVEVAAQIDGTGGSYFLYLSIPLRAALAFGNLLGAVVGLVIWLRFSYKLRLTDPAWLASQDSIEAIFFFPIGIIFVLAVARLVSAERSARQQREQLLADLTASHAQLSAYAAEVEHLSAAAERNRLARDIHDGLGHNLTALNVQLRRVRAFRERDPAQAEQAIDEGLRLTQQALDDVRRSVGMLRTTGQLFALEPLLADLLAPLRAEGVVVHVQTAGSSAEFAPASLMALHRALQEGLTNIQRHAGASAVWLDVRFDSEAARLQLRDNGRGFAQDGPASPSSGYGLVGMAERLALVGGDCTIESAPGQGTTLTMTVPREALDVMAQRLAAPIGASV